MATKKNNKTYSVMRWYKVLKSTTVVADNIQDASVVLSGLKYADFDSDEDNEPLPEESIFTNAA